MSLQERRSELSHALADHIARLKGLGKTREQIAAETAGEGGPTLHMLNQVAKRDGTLFGPIADEAFRRYCSRHGLDALSSRTVCEGKTIVALPPEVRIDGCVLAELRDVMEDVGAISEQERAEDYGLVARHADEGIGALVAIKAEALALASGRAPLRRARHRLSGFVPGTGAVHAQPATPTYLK